MASAKANWMNGATAATPDGALAPGSEAARGPGPEAAAAPRPGAAQPPLDLSLGHIGTTQGVREPEVEFVGPFLFGFDGDAGEGAHLSDPNAFMNRAERRAAKKEFRKLAARVAREIGFAVVRSRGRT